MDISCAFATSSDTPAHVEPAESPGYRRAWLYDSPALYPDVPSLLPSASWVEVYRGAMIAKIVVTALLAAMLGFAGLIKIAGAQQSLTVRDHLGLNPVQWRTIGALELAAVAGVLTGLVWPPIGVAAAVGSALLLVGAIGFHARASDSAAETAPAVIGLGLAVATAVLQLGGIK